MRFITKEEDEKLKTYRDTEKVINDEYGDTIDFLGKQWSTLAWFNGIPPKGGIELIEIIKKDVAQLLLCTIKEVKNGNKKGNINKIRKFNK